ncbi:21165_t:CDS:2, partial [Racocetra persica]
LKTFLNQKGGFIEEIYGETGIDKKELLLAELEEEKSSIKSKEDFDSNLYFVSGSDILDYDKTVRELYEIKNEAFKKLKATQCTYEKCKKDKLTNPYVYETNSITGIKTVFCNQSCLNKYLEELNKLNNSSQTVSSPKREEKESIICTNCDEAFQAHNRLILERKNLEVPNFPTYEELEAMQDEGKLENYVEQKIEEIKQIREREEAEKSPKHSADSDSINQEIQQLQQDIKQLEANPQNNPAYQSNLNSQKQKLKALEEKANKQPSLNNSQQINNLSDFVNLEELVCYDNELTSLNLNNCTKLREIRCSDNQLTNLDDMGKLKELDIDNTDIDSGLEYLPVSLEKFFCSVHEKKDAKVRSIYNLFTNEEGEVETDNAKKEAPTWFTNYQEDYQILSERFKKYDLCPECEQPNTGEQWCQE